MYTGSDLCVHQRFFTGYCTDHSIFTWNNNIDSKWDNPYDRRFYYASVKSNENLHGNAGRY